MFKRFLFLVIFALAVAAPAAVAADGTPAPAGQAPPAAGHSAGNLEQRADALRKRLDAAFDSFQKHCTGDHVRDVAKCTAFAQKALGILQKVDARGDEIVAKIQQKCAPSPTEQAVPKGCEHADQLVQIVRTIQSHVRDLEQKLQDWLASPPAQSTTGGGNGAGNDGGVSQALAGAKAAAQSSGL